MAAPKLLTILFWAVLAQGHCLTETVNVKSQNDVIIGQPLSEVVLMHRERVFDNQLPLHLFRWQGSEQIHRVEVLDQSNGTGGRVQEVFGGIQHNYVSLLLNGSASNPIDFIVQVYGARMNATNRNDIVKGLLSSRSFLINSTRTNSSLLRIDSPTLIKRYEIFDLNQLTQTLSIHVSGGINQRSLQIQAIPVELNVPIDLRVRIFTEPADLFDGQELTNAITLLQTSHVFSYEEYAEIRILSRLPIRRIEVLDQSPGNGGFVSWASHIGSSEYRLNFGRIADLSQSIDFIVNAYVDATGPNNVYFGQRTVNSTQLLSSRLTLQNVTNWREWELDSDDLITYVELLDQTNGTGANINWHYINDARISLSFSDLGRIDYQVNVFGIRLADINNNLILGELTSNSRMLKAIYVYEQHKTVTTYVFESQHILTRIEVLDQNRGRSGQARIVHGGIGHKSVVVLFTGSGSREIYFVVRVFAG